MDINHSEFPNEALKIIQEVAESHFIAFDLEFSGVAGRRANGTGKLNLQEYYDDTKAAAEKYQILQVGLTIVKEDTAKGQYIARPYNFNISPLTSLRERHFGREWSYHSGAISFLMRNGFKFDLPLSQGVQYLSRKEEQQARNTIIQDEEKRSKIADMTLKKEDDVLVEHIRSLVKDWQAQCKEQQEPYLNIPGDAPGVPEQLTRYQIRLTHQVVRNEYPMLKTDGKGHFVQVTNPTQEQQASEKLVQALNRERDLSHAIGFRWLIEAIVGGTISAIPEQYVTVGLPSLIKNKEPPKAVIDRLQQKLKSRRRVFVGHNCFTDLVNLYKCFIGDLPVRVEDFQENVHRLFPEVVDTKYMASFGNKRWGNTSLDEVEAELKTQKLPRIYVPSEYDRYQNAASYHEAGYDSLLTAKIAIKLSAKMESEGKYLEQDQDAIPESSAVQAAFGAEKDGYATATESPHTKASSEGGLVKTVSKALSTPLTAVKMFFEKEEASSRAASTSAANADDLDSTSASGDPKEIVAVKENPRPMNLSDKDEVKKVKNRLASTNIYDLLQSDPAASDNSMEEDLISFSSGANDPGSPFESKDLDPMVKKGDLMPRWGGSNGFWPMFGNKLQVNGSKEGVCRLA